MALESATSKFALARNENCSLAHASGFHFETSQGAKGMTIAEAFLAEFEQEARTTRKFLERLPADKLAWKPHEKSKTAGGLALHIATSPGGVVRMAQADEAAPPNFGRSRRALRRC